MSTRHGGPIQAATAVLLVAVFPVLSLLSENYTEIAAGLALRSLAVSVALSLILLGVAWCGLRDWSRAALWLCGLLLFFFSYGHVYDLVRSISIGGVLLGRHRFLLPLWAIGAAGWTWFLLRHTSGSRRGVQAAVVIGSVLVAMPLIGIVRQELTATGKANIETTSLALSTNDSIASADPDIYYIVLDGYGRADVLGDLYGLDNEGFADFLASRGFYVAQQARSNYPHTRLSLASSLNLIYLDELAATMGPESKDKGPLAELIQHSAVRNGLEARGYRTISFETGYPPTDLRDASIFYPTPFGEAVQHLNSGEVLPAANEFEGILLQTTLLRPLLDSRTERLNSLMGMLSFPYVKQRIRVEYVLAELPKVAHLEGPKFVFAYVPALHAPFVFGANGESVVNSGPFNRQVAGNYTPEEYIRAYQDQLIYINRLVVQAIDGILANSAAPPIIILQADHGPEALADYADPIQGNMRERMSILNAYYLPGSPTEDLYPGISPVNTFRLIFNKYFGTHLQLLEDRSYFALNSQPYLQTDITQRAEGDG